MVTDGSNNLFRTREIGNYTEYILTAGTNTANYRTVFSGNTSGSTSSISLGNAVPSTAAKVRTLFQVSGSGNENFGPYSALAANQQGGTTNQAVAGYSSVFATTMQEFLLQGTTIYYNFSTGVQSIQVMGWTDRVNAT
jgi:hypothetical protein